jgi:PBP1b-binding outer membrane lipoprotein LpoB
MKIRLFLLAASLMFVGACSQPAPEEAPAEAPAAEPAPMPEPMPEAAPAADSAAPVDSAAASL